MVHGGRQGGRTVERVAMAVASLILGLFFYQLYSVYQKEFENVPRRLAEGSIVNLNSEKAGERLGLLLEKGFYFEDRRDIALIAATVTKGLAATDKTIDNIGELNKVTYNVDATDAYKKGGESFKKRVSLSRALLGFQDADSARFLQEVAAPPPLPGKTDLGTGRSSIRGAVRDGGGKPVPGVLVRLEQLLPQDSLYSAGILDVNEIKVETTPTVRRVFALDSANRKQLQFLAAYARTDEKGEYQFTGLTSGAAYGVIPLQPGFQFGSSRGLAALQGEARFDFTQRAHRLRLFSGKDFNNLKREGALIVRTPGEATRWYWIIAGAFFLSFFLLHLFLSLKFPSADQLILPVVMLLTGLSFLTLLSLQDPLRDRFLARGTLTYFGVGILVMLLLLLFDLRRFTTDSGLYRMAAFGGRNGAQGWQWGALAALLLLLTVLFGSGPEGSGVKVNLLGFQPSELVKMVLILFLAGFFAANEKFISQYVTFQKRWSFFYGVLAAILLTILLFLLLGDLGPAIVVCFTFIILFSFSRGDFSQMAGTIVLYVLATSLIDNVWIATGITVLVLGLFTLFRRGQLSESSVMALVVMGGFLLIDQVPYLDRIIPGPVQRLTDRKAIWQDAWDNEVFGGDQVANGIWAMASGGVRGQGIGEGFGKTIPEAHTDMILPALGEELGWAGIISIFLLFLIYLHRSVIIGRQTGRPFLFYLCAGIGISTFVQFLLIAGGSVGALPLSGVSLPFVSYGGSSLIINLAAAGFLLAASALRGTPVQMAYVSRQQDHNLVPALAGACLGILLLSVDISRYLFNNKKWVVKPSLVADRSGGRMFSYNPRISILMNRLQAGSLLDRKGLLLATSRPDLILGQKDSLLAGGLELNRLISLSRRRQARYYPFGEHLFFWTGDENTGVFMGGSNGYFAEYELGADLRGFPTPTVNYNVTASRYVPNRFLPPAVQAMTVSKKDFSALAPLLVAGINSPEVAAFKQRNRDVQLSVDASLQTGLQKGLAAHDSLQDNRVSIVVLEDRSGDVLASASWPLPPVADWDRLTMTQREQNQYPGFITLRDLGFTYATQPGSTAKIATALAAFNKMGDSAGSKIILIRPADLIRIKSAEPDEAGAINLERAIVKSNNSYFIKLANEERLQEEMGTVYLRTGMFLRGVGGYYYERATHNESQEEEWRQFWRATEFKSLNSYNPADIRRTRGRGVSGMAWGQGELIATPAAVARLVSGVANGGVLVPHRYILKISDSAIAPGQGIPLVSQPHHADLLTRYMKAQSAGKRDILGMEVAGKTGTPERIWKGSRINDGWYVFFAPKKEGKGHVVVCIRIERTRGSSDAVRLAGELVIPQLQKGGYIKGFEENVVTNTY